MKTPTKAGVSPYVVGEDRCGGDEIYQLEIDRYSTGAYCFWGGGYIGLGSSPYGNLTSVTRVISLRYDVGGPRCGSGWVMYYEPPYTQGTGIKFYFANCNTYDSGNSAFNGDDKVTQVNLN